MENRVFPELMASLRQGLRKQVVNRVGETLPEDLTAEQRSAVLAAANESLEQEHLALLATVETEQRAVEERMRRLEGTTGDLERLGPLGSLALFLRGMQRPLWGFAVLYIDLKVFSGAWKFDDLAQAAQRATTGQNVPDPDQVSQVLADMAATVTSAFWLVNLLVLGFLFGERATKNVLPLVKDLMGKSNSA